MHRSIFIALAALAAGTVIADEPRRADPTDPQAKVPGVEYRSAFADYRALSDDKVSPWRESNETVKGSDEHKGDAARGPAQPKPEAKPPAGGEHGAHK